MNNPGGCGVDIKPRNIILLYISKLYVLYVSFCVFCSRISCLTRMCTELRNSSCIQTFLVIMTLTCKQHSQYFWLIDISYTRSLINRKTLPVMYTLISLGVNVKDLTFKILCKSESSLFWDEFSLYVHIKSLTSTDHVYKLFISAYFECKIFSMHRLSNHKSGQKYFSHNLF